MSPLDTFPSNEEPTAGPFDRSDWPQELRARVVSSGSESRIHGYAVESDLARHYGFADTLYLCLVRELPSPEVARAFEIALIFLAPVAIHEGPTHAAVLARLGGAPVGVVLSVGAVGLAERARAALDRLQAVVDWLERANGEASEPPAVALAADDRDRDSVARLRAALPEQLAVPALSYGVSREAAVVAVLRACGLRRREQLEAAWTFAGLTSCLAEGLATRKTNFMSYAMNLPAFAYETQR
jgi:hypothetical protein